MPKSLMLSLALLMLAAPNFTGGCIAGAPTPSRPPTSVQQEVRAFEAEVMKSYNRGNAAQAASHYANNAFVFIPGQPPTRGREAISANITRFMQDPNFRLAYKNEALEVTASNDLAYTRGTLQVTYTDKQSGAVRTTNGNYLLVLQREPDLGWQVVEDISF